jgi:sulfotransferase family protein
MLGSDSTTDARESMPEAIDAAVIFTGRGGSGTRLLSQLADDLEVFVGNHVNKSGDSIEWVDLVYRLAIESSRSPELPTGSGYRQEIRARAARILEAHRGRPSSPWGFKLPEAMLVLPLLVDAFPAARIVHLIRHPVSSSLRRTHMTSRLNNALGAATLPNAYRFCGREARSITADEPYVHNAVSWNYQVRRVVDYARARLDRDRYLELRYEDLCDNPAPVVARVRSFLGRERGDGATAVAVDPSRASHWDAADPRVETIWNLCGETAGLLGYTRENIDPARRPGAQSAQQRD